MRSDVDDKTLCVHLKSVLDQAAIVDTFLK